MFKQLILALSTKIYGIHSDTNKIWYKFLKERIGDTRTLLNIQRNIWVSLLSTHREITPSNKFEALTKSYIWAIGPLNRLFIRGSHTQSKFSKRWTSQWQKSFFVIDGFCTPHSVCLNIGFSEAAVQRCS